MVFWSETGRILCGLARDEVRVVVGPYILIVVQSLLKFVGSCGGCIVF